MIKVIKPKKLEVGDTVGVVASSLPVLPSFRENFERGKRVLREMGFEVKEGGTIGKARWWMAGTPREVAEDINQMFAEVSVKAIMAQTGGYSALSVLEYLDFDLIRQNPKPYIGISDVTNFHLGFLAKAGLVGFHMGDLTFGLGHEWKEGEEKLGEFERDVFKRFLMESRAPGIIEPLSEWKEWKKGQAMGKLIGGNLYVMQGLIGTEYFPKLEEFEGAIFYWEEIGASKFDIARRFYQLKYLGVLERISGMLIGKVKYLKPIREEEVVEPTLKEMLLEIFEEYDFPIMADVDFGHFTVNIPMPVGVEVEFETSGKRLEFLEGAVI